MKNTWYYTPTPEEQADIEQFIRGSLLGDGCIAKLGKNSKNNRISFGHSEKQLCYLNWKQNYLDKFDMSGKITKVTAVSKRYKTGQCISYHFKSRSNPIFTKYRSLYYPNNIKKLDRQDIVNINELGLAIWFMDDGYILRSNNKNSCLIICTTSFTREDTEFLIELLRNKWNVKCSYYSSEKGIRISVSDSPKFLKLIEPYKIDCLDYKWVLNKEEELLEN